MRRVKCEGSDEGTCFRCRDNGRECIIAPIPAKGKFSSASSKRSFHETSLSPSPSPEVQQHPKRRTKRTVVEDEEEEEEEDGNNPMTRNKRTQHTDHPSTSQLTRQS